MANLKMEDLKIGDHVKGICTKSKKCKEIKGVVKNVHKRVLNYSKNDFVIPIGNSCYLAL